MRASWAVVAVVVAACGSPGSLSIDASGDPGPIDGRTDAGDGWTDLIQRGWTVAAGIEDYRCRRIQVTQDTYITGFRALSPPGTHHELLTFSPTLTQTGDFDCNASAIASEPEMLFAAGEATPAFEFPAGVAIKIPANSYILLYLHLYNVSDATETETSGVQVKTIAAADVQHEADMIFGGSMNFSIPATNAPYSHTSDCGASSDWHIVGMWPHMHQWGTHMTVVTKHISTVTGTLLDTDYSLGNQQNYAMNVTVPVNDRIETTCTWVNTTSSPAQTLYYGDSATQEMCFSGMYKWPKAGNLYTCTERP